MGEAAQIKSASAGAGIYQFAYTRNADQDAPEPVSHPIVIVGAGPVGLSLAIDLAQRGRKVVLLDDADRIGEGSRAICFSKRSLEVWDRLGVGDRMLERGVEWKVGKVFLGDGLVYGFDLLPEDGHKRPAFINLQQYYAEKYLVERVAQLPAIDLRWRNKVTGLERTNDGPDEPEWRSGIKHDAAKVMELRRVGETFVNGLGETVDLEPSHVLPLMKGSDVANRRAPGARALVVPQRALFDPTEALAESAPRTYTYLRRHEATLLARKSRIYTGRPAFSIFGVGPYAFAPYKVAVCGLYKRLAFHLVGPCDGQPVVFDDTVTFLPFDDEASAARVAKALESPLAREFFEARVFWDEQRPLGKAVLQRLSLRALLEAENGPGDPFSLERHPKEP